LGLVSKALRAIGITNLVNLLHKNGSEVQRILSLGETPEGSQLLRYYEFANSATIEIILIFVASAPHLLDKLSDCSKVEYNAKLLDS